MVPYDLDYSNYNSNSLYVTGSAKTGLIAHDRKFIFLSQTQRHINTLSSFTAKMK